MQHHNMFGILGDAKYLLKATLYRILNLYKKDEYGLIHLGNRSVEK